MSCIVLRDETKQLFFAVGRREAADAHIPAALLEGARCWAKPAARGGRGCTHGAPFGASAGAADPALHDRGAAGPHVPDA